MNHVHKKINEFYSVKTIVASVKDVDAQTRRVKVAFSSFDNVDSDGDIIRRGAYAKSILERGPDSTGNRKIGHLRYHDWEHPIAVIQKLEETHTHLVSISDLGRSTQGTDALLDYQDGIINEHSVGFNYIGDKMEFIEHGDGGFWEIKELNLWEGSAVLFGANSLTPTLDVSKGEHIAQIDKINNRMYLLINTLKNGKGTDERLHYFEMQLKTLQQQYNEIISSLSSIEPSAKGTRRDKPNETAEEIANREKEDAKKLFYQKLLS